MEMISNTQESAPPFSLFLPAFPARAPAYLIPIPSVLIFLRVRQISFSVFGLQEVSLR